MNLSSRISVLYFLILLCSWSSVFSQEDEFYDIYHIRHENFIYHDSIKTAIIHKKGWVLTQPVIGIHDTICLMFDDLQAEVHDYSYTLIHCNWDWTPSGLMENEFIEGYTEDQIINYDYSFNTLIPYIHYEVEIPNENMQFTLPGNYILLVYDDFDKEKPILTKRFSVYEGKVPIDAKIKRATNLDEMNTHQEIDFELNTGSLNVTNPLSEIKVVIAQNNRWDNAVTNLKPMHIQDDKLIYNYEDGNTFAAGSEYRFFDIKSIRYQSARIVQIVYEEPYTHVQLTADKSERFGLYHYHQDLNGKYLPEIQEYDNAAIEADYVMVHFTLPYDAPMVDGNFYVFGGLTNWTCNNKNLMHYNFKEKAYKKQLLLKQGYYNYSYVYLEDGKKAYDRTFLEGSHYETENDYYIYVYYRNFTERFDRLVGVEIINSLRGK